MDSPRIPPVPAPAPGPATTAEAIEANIFAYLLSFGSLPGAVRHDGVDVSWIDSGFPTAIFNSVVAARFRPEDADRRIDTVLAHFRRVARPLTWYIGPTSEPADLGPLLMARDLAFTEDEPGMALALDQMSDNAAKPDGLTIEPVRTEGELVDWVDVWLFPVPEAARGFFRDLLRHRALGASAPWRYYVGRLDGRPVATVELFIDGVVASLQYVVTVPTERRRGIGAAMTRRALDDARARGCRLAVLTASPDGFGIYHRLGFREYCRIRRYEWTPGKEIAAIP